MKKETAFLLIVFVLLMFFVSARDYYTEETELYEVEKYVMHENGIEVWAKNKGKIDGYFFEYDAEKIYQCEEKTSRVVAIYGVNSEARWLSETYLYLSKQDFKHYLSEIYNIEW